MTNGNEGVFSRCPRDRKAVRWTVFQAENGRRVLQAAFAALREFAPGKGSSMLIKSKRDILSPKRLAKAFLLSNCQPAHKVFWKSRNLFFKKGFWSPKAILSQTPLKKAFSLSNIQPAPKVFWSS